MKNRFILVVLMLTSALGIRGVSAAETQAGDTCTAGQTGWSVISGGPEQNPPQHVRCNGTTWVAISTGAATNLSETISINDLSDGIYKSTDSSIFLGASSGVTNTGINNSGLGVGALQKNTTGNHNQAFGPEALYSNTTGNFNTAGGYRALYSNVTGSTNTAYGYRALLANTSSNNTAVGNNALYSNTSGGLNTAFGSQALLNNTTSGQNTAVGFQAMSANTTGANNVGVGYQALNQNLTGSRNTGIGVSAGSGVPNSVIIDTVAIGYQAGNSLTSSTNNTLVGSLSGRLLSSGSSNTLIGYNAGGNLTTGAQNIIIGNNIGASTAATNNQINIGNILFGDIVSKSIGIGIIPSVELAVSGSIEYTGGINDISDRRLKTAIKSWHGSALEKMALMKPVTFQMKNNRNVTEYGFIAQDVQPVFPELITTAKDASRTLSMNYVGMVAPMVKAIQELKAENDHMKRQLAALCAATKACH